MSHDRRSARRKNARAFRPTMEDQRLESREVLSHVSPASLNQFLLTHPQRGFAYQLRSPAQIKGLPARALGLGHGPNYTQKGVVATQTAHGGQSVIVAAPDGSRFKISLVLADNQYAGGLTAQTGGSGTNVLPAGTRAQPTGTVRAYPMAGGKVGIIVDGTTDQMALSIDPLPFAQRKGFAHSFAYGEGGRSHILNIGSINVTSGSIAQILGYHDADLSGPLSIGGTNTVDRIAFDSLLPGATIGVGGTLNTLDILNNVNLSSGPGITIGQDLNLMNVGQNFNLSNGAQLLVGRYLGLTPQPAKGSATGSNILTINQALLGTGTSVTIPSVSAYILGDMTIGKGSSVVVGSAIVNSSLVSTTGQTTLQSGSPTPFVINGKLNVNPTDPTKPLGQIEIPGLIPGSGFIVQEPNPTPPPSTIAVATNFIARNGLYNNGVRIA